MQFIAIGDIHGCVNQLEELLSLTQSFPNHKLIFLGDYIDRGPNSDEVISIIQNLDAIFLLGNHEAMFLEMIDIYSKTKPKLFPEILDRKKISKKNYEWIKSSLLTHLETDEYFFSHAGLNPNKPLQKQTEEDYIWTYYEGSYIHLTKKLVIQGHIRGEKVRIKENHYLIDTGCGMGGYLTGLVLPEKIILQSKTRSVNLSSIKYI